MDNSENIVEYHDAGCVFKFNKSSNVLQVIGTMGAARPTILRLRREGWLPRKIRAIYFHREDGVTDFVVGVNLVVYVTASGPKQNKPKTRSFKDMCQPRA